MINAAIVVALNVQRANLCFGTERKARREQESGDGECERDGGACGAKRAIVVSRRHSGTSEGESWWSGSTVHNEGYLPLFTTNHP